MFKKKQVFSPGKIDHRTWTQVVTNVLVTNVLVTNVLVKNVRLPFSVNHSLCYSHGRNLYCTYKSKKSCPSSKYIIKIRLHWVYKVLFCVLLSILKPEKNVFKIQVFLLAAKIDHRTQELRNRENTMRSSSISLIVIHSVTQS